MIPIQEHVVHTEPESKNVWWKKWTGSNHQVPHCNYIHGSMFTRIHSSDSLTSVCADLSKLSFSCIFVNRKPCFRHAELSFGWIVQKTWQRHSWSLEDNFHHLCWSQDSSWCITSRLKFPLLKNNISTLYWWIGIKFGKYIRTLPKDEASRLWWYCNVTYSTKSRSVAI